MAHSHTAASMMVFPLLPSSFPFLTFIFILFYFRREVAGAESRCKGTGDGWDWDAWYERHKVNKKES